SNRQQRQRCNHPRHFRSEALRAMPYPSNKEGQSKHKETVPQNRANQRSLEHRNKPIAQGEIPNKEFRQIAKRRLQYACRSWAKARTHLLGSNPYQRGKQGKSTSRYHKGDDSIRMKSRQYTRRDTQNECSTSYKPFIPAQKPTNISQRKRCHPVFDSYQFK